MGSSIKIPACVDAAKYSPVLAGRMARVPRRPPLATICWWAMGKAVRRFIQSLKISGDLKLGKIGEG
jgi:hypothetical protein